MKKKRYMAACVCLTGVLLTGCGVQMPELTDEEAALITEYATNLIVKHSTISDRNLLSEMDFKNGALEEERILERKEKEEEIIEQMLNGELEAETAKENESSEVTTESGSGIAASQSMASFYGENNFSIDYVSYELTDSYPKEGTEELFIAMDATDGNQFCVLKFSVTNITDEGQDLNMFSKKGRFILKMSDGKLVQAQTTMLLDDLSFYKGEIAAGESKELVLLFEVSDDINQMDSMQLIMKNENGDNTIQLG